MAPHKAFFLSLLGVSLLLACQQPPTVPLAAFPPVVAPEAFTAAPLPTSSPTPLPATLTPLPTSTPPTPTATATPYYTGPLSTPCGQGLPLLPTHTTPAVSTLAPDAVALEAVRAIMPDTAVPAWQHILQHPGSVGLVVYRAGDEANGVYLNADMQMPLASVVKVISLVAYVEAVTNGQVNAAGYVTTADLDVYHLPGYDLWAHDRALMELEDKGLLEGDPPQVRLEEVPWMMIRHSSNAAADYLQGLLGQEAIEATAVAMALTSQTAPCPWVGQFMAMGNHTRNAPSDATAIRAYLDNPTAYGREASRLTDAYVHDTAFREEERIWHGRTRRPSVEVQHLFSHSLNAHGSPRDYANLMARLAQNGLSSPDSSFLARKYLEWPMVFPDNQVLFSNLGYKNGSLPGILTTVYYAYPQGENTPVVVALFFRDLPNSTYRAWRSTLPHDEFARWLLYDPAAIVAVRAALQP